MTYPAGVTTATITAGVPFDVFGDDGTVTLTVKPYFGGTATRIIHAATGRPFVDSPRAGTSAGGAASSPVPHVDQAGFIDGAGNTITMWSYVCTVTMTVSGATTTLTQAVQPLVGQATIDLDLTPDGTVGAPSSSPVPAVTSVNGMTGAVTVSEAAATNLSVTRTGTAVTVASDTGTDAALAAADGTNAGVMTAALYTKLANLANAPVRFAAETAVTGTTGTDRASTSRTITEARMRVGSAPVGSALTAEVQHWNGSAWSVVTTLTIAAGSTTEAVQSGLSQAQVTGNLVRLNVTSVGSTTAAGDVVVDVVTG